MVPAEATRNIQTEWDRRTDRQMFDKVIPMWRFALLAQQIMSDFVIVLNLTENRWAIDWV